MLDNARQCRDKISAAADKKSLVFYPFPFQPLIALLAWTRRILRAISLSGETNKDCKGGKSSSAEFDIWSWYSVHFI